MAQYQGGEPNWVQRMLLQHGMKIIMVLLVSIGSLFYGAYRDLKASIAENQRTIRQLQVELKESFARLDKKVDLRDQLFAVYQETLKDHEERIRKLERTIR
jgi:hypothetical protein